MAKKVNEITPIQKNIHNDFNVYHYKDNNSFIHIEIKDTQAFYNKIFDYFFYEDRLIKYAEGKAGIKFNRSKKDYTTLYKHLKLYIDDYNQKKEISKLEDELKDILLDEGLIEEDENNKLLIRLDKIGRMGEYFFSCLLNEYFGFDCIIPKVHLTTDPNMNVYGIDTIYYNSKKDEILFGESKFSKSLDNGIKLIKKSLKTYEEQIRDEFVLILSDRVLKENLNVFNEKYGELAEVCIDIEEFIEVAKIKSIGVPIFIAHGTETSYEEILVKLSKIEEVKFFGIDTTFYTISLPIVNKMKLISTITVKIRERMEHYIEQRKSI